MQKERVLQFVAVACSSIKDPALLKRTLIDFLKVEWPDIMEGKRLAFPLIKINEGALREAVKNSPWADAAYRPWKQEENRSNKKSVHIHIDRLVSFDPKSGIAQWEQENAVDVLIRALNNLEYERIAAERISSAARGAREVVDGKPDIHKQAAADGVFRGKPFGQDLLFGDAWKFMLMGNTVKRKGWTGSQYLKLQNGEPHHFTGSVGNKVNHMPIEDVTATDWYINN